MLSRCLEHYEIIGHRSSYTCDVGFAQCTVVVMGVDGICGSLSRTKAHEDNGTLFPGKAWNLLRNVDTGGVCSTGYPSTGNEIFRSLGTHIKCA